MILLYNDVMENGYISDKGLSILIPDGDEYIMFDTGSEPVILENNIRHYEKENKEQILDKITTVVISHMHDDHKGGLDGILSLTNIKLLVMPRTASQDYVNLLKYYYRNTKILISDNYREISKDIWITRGIGKFEEISLYDKNNRTVYVGCSHCGIENIIEDINNTFFENDVMHIVGGLHMIGEMDKERIEKIGMLRDHGIISVMPLHCSKVEVRK